MVVVVVVVVVAVAVVVVGVGVGVGVVVVGVVVGRGVRGRRAYDETQLPAGASRGGPREGNDETRKRDKKDKEDKEDKSRRAPPHARDRRLGKDC